MDGDFDRLVRDLSTILDGPAPEDINKAFAGLLNIAKSQQAQIKRLKKQVRKVAHSQAQGEVYSEARRVSESAARVGHDESVPVRQPRVRVVDAGDGSAVSVDDLFAKALARQRAGVPAGQPITSLEICKNENLVNAGKSPSQVFVRRALKGY